VKRDGSIPLTYEYYKHSKKSVQRPDVGVEARGDELMFQRVEGEVVD